jgi:hypothetical protein
MMTTIRDTSDDPERRALITSLRVEANPRHWRITVWNRGGKAGTLTVNAADGPAVVDRLIPPERQVRLVCTEAHHAG